MLLIFFIKIFCHKCPKFWTFVTDFCKFGHLWLTWKFGHLWPIWTFVWLHCNLILLETSRRTHHMNLVTNVQSHKCPKSQKSKVTNVQSHKCPKFFGHKCPKKIWTFVTLDICDKCRYKRVRVNVEMCQIFGSQGFVWANFQLN